MKLIQSEYKITPDVLARHGTSVDCQLLHGMSTEAEIMNAVDLITPRSSGIDLIRVGGDLDGGYLIPNDLDGIDACFSPGTNNFKRFEDDLLKSHEIKSFMCDFTSSIENFCTPLVEGKQFFYKKWLDVDGSDDALDINDWVHENAAPSADCILQMDIEGAEYRNLINASNDTINRFRIIIIELHDIQRLSDRGFLHGVFNPALKRLADTHTCVHIHANNACGETALTQYLTVPQAVEVTFLRKDRCLDSIAPVQIPHPLDQPNVVRTPPILLKGAWLEHADDELSRYAGLEQQVRWLIERVETLTRFNQFYSSRTLTGNIAPNGVASQSTLSPYSTFRGAQGGIKGYKTGSFGFHTAEEDADPWWKIDLGDVYSLDACLLFNRMDAAAIRSRSLQLFTSLDGLDWEHRYSHTGKPIFGGLTPHDGQPPLLVTLCGIHARHIKLALEEPVPLHLDEIEIYGTRIPK